MLTALMREACHFRTVTCPGLGCLAANSLGEMLPAASDAAEVLEQLTHAFIARLQQLVEGAVARSELPATTDASATGLAIQAMIMGLNLQSKVITNEPQLWASSQAMLADLDLYQE